MQLTYIILLVVLGFNTLTLALIAIFQRKLESARSLAISMGFMTAAISIFANLWNATPWQQHALSNIFLILGFIFIHFSFPEVRARGRSQYILCGVLLLTMFCGMTWFSVFQDSRPTRLMIFCTLMTIQSLNSAWIIFRNASPSIRVPARCIAATFLVYAIICITRMGVMMTAVMHGELALNPIRWSGLVSILWISGIIPMLCLWTTTARLQESLERMATTDALTSLLNRRAIEEEGNRECSRSHRYRKPLSVIILDLDHFKRLNDTYGHLAGDEVLKAISLLTASTLRAHDRLARIGGEEFLLMLPETTLHGALELSERLRVLFESTPVPIRNRSVNLTASFGVAVSEDDNDSWVDLFGRADAALYFAKAEGRNRVASSNDVPTAAMIIESLSGPKETRRRAGSSSNRSAAKPVRPNS